MVRDASPPRTGRRTADHAHAHAPEGPGLTAVDGGVLVVADRTIALYE